MRYLRSTKTGVVFPWSELLAKRKDMEPYAFETAVPDTAEVEWDAGDIGPEPEVGEVTFEEVPNFDRMKRQELVSQASKYGMEAPVRSTNEQLRAWLKENT